MVRTWKRTSRPDWLACRPRGRREQAWVVCGHRGSRHRGPDAIADSTVRGACSHIYCSSFIKGVRSSNVAPCSGMPCHALHPGQPSGSSPAPPSCRQSAAGAGAGRGWLHPAPPAPSGPAASAAPARDPPTVAGLQGGQGREALLCHAGAHTARRLCRRDHHGTTTCQPSTLPAPHTAPVAPGGRPQSAPSRGTGGSCSSGRGGSCTAGSAPAAAASSLPSASLSLGSATGCCALAARCGCCRCRGRWAARPRLPGGGAPAPFSSAAASCASVGAVRLAARDERRRPRGCSWLLRSAGCSLSSAEPCLGAGGCSACCSACCCCASSSFSPACCRTGCSMGCPSNVAGACWPADGLAARCCSYC